MKRVLIFLLGLLLLTGCRAEDEAMEQVLLCRQQLNSAQGCEFDAYITADYGDKLYTFTLACRADAGGEVEFTVVDPESIRGINGRIDGAKGALTFDDQALAFSLLADGELSPVTAPWLLLKTLRSGYIHGCSRDEEYTYALIHDSYEADALQAQIWFNRESVPTNADFLWQGRRILSLEVKNFRFI